MNLIKTMILVLSLGASVSGAHQADYNVSVGSRSTPFALQVEAIAGYGFLLWGDTSSPFYGYLRPSVDFSASSTLTGMASLDFYPLSFLGFTFGKSYSNRLADLPGIDCEKADCRNWLNDNFFQARLLGQWGSFVTSLQYEKRIYENNDDLNKPFGEGSYVVLLAPHDEVAEIRQVIVGYKAEENLTVGLNVQDFKAHKSAEQQEMQLLFAKKDSKEWSYTFGVGRFASSQFGIGPEAVVMVTWTGAEKIGP